MRLKVFVLLIVLAVVTTSIALWRGVGAQVQQPTSMAIPSGPNNPDSSTCTPSTLYAPYYQSTVVEIFMCSVVSPATDPTWNLVAGQIGPTGPTGSQGATGSTGSTGSSGATGSTGTAGTNGTNGSNGATGATGSTGTSGVSYLSGTTSTITGTLLAVGGFDSGTVSISGATAGMGCLANTSDGSEVSTSVTIRCDVTSTNTVTVKVIAFVIATPGSKAYSVRVFP